MPDSWYADVVATARAATAARSRSTPPTARLRALADGFDRAAPDLIKPNAEELAGVTGFYAAGAGGGRRAGRPEPVVSAAQRLVDRGVGAVLATLGAAGAVLVTADGAWLATPPPIVPRSTVGAGDSSLAGYLRADVAGAEPADGCRSPSPTAAPPPHCPAPRCPPPPRSTSMPLRSTLDLAAADRPPRQPVANQPKVPP